MDVDDEAVGAEAERAPQLGTPSSGVARGQVPNGAGHSQPERAGRLDGAGASVVGNDGDNGDGNGVVKCIKFNYATCLNTACIICYPFQGITFGSRDNESQNASVQADAERSASGDPEMMHASKCSTVDCQIDNCRLLKFVLMHLNTCDQPFSCPMEQCSSSDDVRLHYSACTSTGCFCSLLRRAAPFSRPAYLFQDDDDEDENQQISP